MTPSSERFRRHPSGALEWRVATLTTASAVAARVWASLSSPRVTLRATPRAPAQISQPEHVSATTLRGVAHNAMPRRCRDERPELYRRTRLACASTTRTRVGPVHPCRSLKWMNEPT